MSFKISFYAGLIIFVVIIFFLVTVDTAMQEFSDSKIEEKNFEGFISFKEKDKEFQNRYSLEISQIKINFKKDSTIFSYRFKPEGDNFDIKFGDAEISLHFEGEINDEDITYIYLSRDENYEDGKIFWVSNLQDVRDGLQYPIFKIAENDLRIDDMFYVTFITKGMFEERNTNIKMKFKSSSDIQELKIMKNENRILVEYPPAAEPSGGTCIYYTKKYNIWEGDNETKKITLTYKSDRFYVPPWMICLCFPILVLILHRLYKKYQHEKDKEVQRNSVRNSLEAELKHSLSCLQALLDEIKELKLNYKRKLSEEILPPCDTDHEFLLEKLEILPQIESQTIKKIYETLGHIYDEYDSIAKEVNKVFYFSVGNDTQDIKPLPKVLPKDTLQRIDQLKKDILDVTEGIKAWQEFFGDENISKFEKKVKKLFEK